jgi:methylmalonyl-CoA/ethylmalonyl-CoA epimerase
MSAATDLESPHQHHREGRRARHGILPRCPVALLFTVPGMAFFDCGGVRLMLGTPSSPEYDHPSSILYFRVPDIQAGYQQLVQNSVEIVAPPRLIAPMPAYDLWMTAFRDSEGNIHQLMSEVPRSA